jgi:hypothetical protein
VELVVPEAIGALAQKEDASSTRQQLLTWCFVASTF